MTPTVFLGGKISLWEGDCLDVLAGLEPESVDSCVTDPPYHLASIVKRFGETSLADDTQTSDRSRRGADGYARSARGFMGKTWDGGDIAFDPGTWAAVLRVLKPGGHMVAFGAPKNAHRLTCAIEDAGFEIRDVVMYLFGSGFPKSHNVKKAAGNAVCRCSASAYQMPGVRDGETHSLRLAEKEQERFLQPILPSQDGDSTDIDVERPQGAGWLDGSQLGKVSPEDDRIEEPSMEGRGDLSQAARQLRERPLRPLPAGVPVDGAGGRLRDGAPARDGAVDRSATASGRVRSPQGSQAAGEPALEFGTVAGQPKPQDGGAWPTCGGCGKPIVPDGLGTALKPAYEPIILARKPLIGTVAANILAHGTGAINVDGCRVEHVTVEGGNLALNPHLRQTINGGNGGKIFPAEVERRAVTPHVAGRWPANVVHDGSDDVLAAFPDAPGVLRAVNETFAPKVGTPVYGDYGPRPHVEPRGDTGSAARFFYSAKADADDRLGSKHPTVKPVDLMRWLVRMVTPPGGLVLDPFAGTGTTGEAAFYEGFRAALIEREPEYQADIARRMKLVLSGSGERARESAKARHAGAPQDDGPLFSR